MCSTAPGKKQEALSMAKANLSQAYRLIVKIIIDSQLYKCNLNAFEEAVLEDDASLDLHLHLFSEYLGQLETAVDVGGYPLTEALVLVRIGAMNLSSIFSNLEENIDAIIAAR